jgi:hypothetical protein
VHAVDCRASSRPDEDFVWVTRRWRLRSYGGSQPYPLPLILLLEPRAHLDLGELDDVLAAELGVLTVHLERAITGLGGIGRVHVVRWGDGGAHLHVWFIARPEGLLQLRGSALAVWLDVLPPLPIEVTGANEARVAAALTTSWAGAHDHGGGQGRSA